MNLVFFAVLCSCAVSSFPVVRDESRERNMVTSSDYPFTLLCKEGTLIANVGTKEVLAHIGNKKIRTIVELLNTRLENANRTLENSKWKIDWIETTWAHDFDMPKFVSHSVVSGPYKISIFLKKLNV